MDNVVTTFAMGVNDPTPAISDNGAAIAARPASSGKLVSDQLPVSHQLFDMTYSKRHLQGTRNTSAVPRDVEITRENDA
jgi:hypothetical protein